MARVLVLGGTSYVAQFVLQQVLQDDALRVASGGQMEDVSAVACTIRSEPFSPLPAGFVTTWSEPAARVVGVYWQVDISDLEALDNCIQDFHPTVVINCTAISSPAVCQKDPDKACSVNEPRGLVTLLEKLPWRIRFVHFSTDFVYEGTQAWAPVFPDTSAPKFMQWLHCQLFQSETAEEPLKLWSDEFRSYLYIHDLVSVLFKLLAIEDNASATLVNLGGVEALSRVELAHRYLAVCGTHNASAVAAITREIVPTAFSGHQRIKC
ncbi:hypothetical protein PF006_g18607 [Phytophthora fragariae]|uniref:RmlD-like substrate binding domain-containing protein n=1 Tax=Phytophthora fragariae TaxID=53985 RepID=A0A6A3EA35_9STRA|nr:hypothetical protein PF009_g20754 [Phytophthora fragariae]KAE9118391.1 hypothetical protein PF006_g18607 [Phytophthora fragariae]KAE9316501.1 hypothetical protein PF008_g18989 [Phytophthora fragariae]